MPRGGNNKTHGEAHVTAEYRIWQAMKNRCLNPATQDYSYYGGRGVTIDPRWMRYENFLADMGRRPTGYTLERVDNNLGYSKGNCIWATRTTQSRNRPTHNKLDLSMANHIRTLYRTGKYRQADIAAWYGVNQTLISAIIRGKVW
jgi:hypothetical protein